LACRRLADTDPLAVTRADYLAELLVELGAKNVFPVPVPVDTFTDPESVAEWLPAGKIQDAGLENILRRLLSALDQAQHTWQRAGGQPTDKELAALHEHLTGSVSYTGLKLDPRRMILETYHVVGARVKHAELTTAVLQLLAAAESVLPELREITAPGKTLEWNTPLGRVRIAGDGDDHHSGSYALLIDLGGDDVYEDVGQELEPGRVSLVIDLKGNDSVRWKERPGPGAGLLGVSVWLDAHGNDSYTGSNMGMGVGLLGAGVLWDMAGDDRYQGGSMVQGVGQYGVGILVDEAGDDRYSAALYGQGFGGSGGIGMQVDLQGNDSYSCGGLVPDQSPVRRKRHAMVHYISACQGYSFGFRPRVSGGVGLLLDRDGSDRYQADLFAQGGAYWFGLGMLVDRAGDDRYKAFEHCQGESLHLGAGFLGDLSGDDSYEGYEHCQGVGMDRAVGILYDYRGNDSYLSNRQSQGAGLKPYGVGILLEAAGNDTYESAVQSQGYALKPGRFPEDQWPVGMLLDLGGQDAFYQPHVSADHPDGRIQGRQGITIDRRD